MQGYVADDQSTFFRNTKCTSPLLCNKWLQNLVLPNHWCSIQESTWHVVRIQLLNGLTGAGTPTWTSTEGHTSSQGPLHELLECPQYVPAMFSENEWHRRGDARRSCVILHHSIWNHTTITPTLSYYQKQRIGNAAHTWWTGDWVLPLE